MDVLDQRAGAMARFMAPVTMLATGGCGQVNKPVKRVHFRSFHWTPFAS